MERSWAPPPFCFTFEEIKQPSAKCFSLRGCLGFLRSKVSSPPSKGSSMEPEGLGGLSLPLRGAGAKSQMPPTNRPPSPNAGALPSGSFAVSGESCHVMSEVPLRAQG